MAAAENDGPRGISHADESGLMLRAVAEDVGLGARSRIVPTRGCLRLGLVMLSLLLMLCLLGHLFSGGARPCSNGNRAAGNTQPQAVLKTRCTSADVLWKPQTIALGEPFFLHVPHGSDNWQATRAQMAAKTGASQKGGPAPSDVAFVFASNRGNSSLGHAYDQLGIPYHVIANSYKPWDWWAKIGPMIELLKSGTITQKYVLMSDADDIFPLTNNFTGLVEAFESYDAKMVLGSTVANWPHMEEEGRFEKCAYPWSWWHRHGQSSYMADAGFLLTVLEEIEVPGSRRRFDDQVALRLLHRKHYPLIKVDTLTRIFARNDKGRYKL
mmetsp:Transcript_56133/g.156410  ORF Transcript_56133/g.156410 Transcript_56133/m.156410 type:complete len:326 (+) Transcript_56133:182-1159(+)